MLHNVRCTQNQFLSDKNFSFITKVRSTYQLWSQGFFLLFVYHTYKDMCGTQRALGERKGGSEKIKGELYQSDLIQLSILCSLNKFSFVKWQEKCIHVTNIEVKTYQHWIVCVKVQPLFLPKHKFSIILLQIENTTCTHSYDNKKLCPQGLLRLFLL